MPRSNGERDFFSIYLFLSPQRHFACTWFINTKLMKKYVLYKVNLAQLDLIALNLLKYKKIIKFIKSIQNMILYSNNK